MLPATGLLVHEVPVEPDDVREQPLGQPVPPHDPGGQFEAALAEHEVAIGMDADQPVTFHPGHGLGDGRATLLEAFGDPCA